MNPHFKDMETWPRLTQQVGGGPGAELMFCLFQPVTMASLTSRARKPGRGTR